MNRQVGMSSLAMVLLLLALGSLLLAGLNQQLETFSAQVRSERVALREQAAVQSALEWGRVQPWSPRPEIQCRQPTLQSQVCLRLLEEGKALLIAASGGLMLWRSGSVLDGRVSFSPRGWSDFCPVKESALCALP